MDFTWVKRKDCKVLLQDSTLVILDIVEKFLKTIGNQPSKHKFLVE
jgi:hypothetical protein